MTRKEFNSYAKKYGIAILCVIPVLFVLDFWLLQKSGTIWTIVINIVVIILAFFLALYVAELWKHHITRKRTEFLNEKDRKRRQQLVEEAGKQTQEEGEVTQQKIWQKQKKSYPSKKRKK